MDFINRIEIKNFTCFENESETFENGINILIGKNGVGKTHLLKLLYSHIHAIENYTDLSIEIEENY